MKDNKDLSGQYFGLWSVIEKNYDDPQHKYKYLCKCACGTLKMVRGADLVSGKSLSCGCLTRPYKKDHPEVTRLIDLRLYTIFNNMRNRCNNPNYPFYANYGGRGIKVCPEWSNVKDFPAFYSWAMSNGYSDDLTLDRIDNNKGYSPDNCRWATRKEQQNNTRHNRIIDYCGIKHTLAEWSDITGIDSGTISGRLDKGWTVEAALNTKVRGKDST